MNNNFFIAFYERSGSTFLVDLLNQHRKIDCKTEIFDTKNISSNGKFNQIPALDENGISEELNFFKQKRILSKIKIKGFKFKFPNQIDHYPSVYKFLKQSEFKCILLIRQNMLKAAVSHQYHKVLREKTGLSNITYKFDLPIINLDLFKALNYLELRQRQTEMFNTQLHADFRNVLTIYYEDLLANKQAVLDKIFNFLGLKTQAILDSKFTKIVKDDLVESVENYFDFYRLMQYTPYITYFYKDKLASIDIKRSKSRLIDFYNHFPDKNINLANKNTYFHKLQDPLNLTDHEVEIFRKINARFTQMMARTKNEYRIKLLKRIKQIEVKLFLGDEKYAIKAAEDKVMFIDKPPIGAKA